MVGQDFGEDGPGFLDLVVYRLYLVVGFLPSGVHLQSVQGARGDLRVGAGLDEGVLDDGAGLAGASADGFVHGCLLL